MAHVDLDVGKSVVLILKVDSLNSGVLELRLANVILDNLDQLFWCPEQQFLLAEVDEHKVVVLMLVNGLCAESEKQKENCLKHFN